MAANGIGDALMGSIVANTMKARYVCKHHGWVRMFYADLQPYSDKAGINFNRNYGQEIATRCTKTRIRRYMDDAGATGEPILPELIERDRITALGKAYQGYVALLPFSCYKNREWGIKHWLTLERLCPYPTIVLDDNAERCRPFQGEKAIRQSPEKVAGILANCRAAIGIDSGLSHLCGLLRVRAIVLGGPTNVRQVLGCYPTLEFIQGGLDCTGCHFQGRLGYSGVCDKGCASLWSISPAEVMRKLEEK